jgi:MFS family permease
MVSGMSPNLSSPNPMQPLSVGNVVSAGLRLYRSHLKSYFQLALKAYLWILVPVYGWAKFYTLRALISRLAFSELVNQPESVEAASRYVNSKLWKFLITALLMLLLGVGIGICFVILVAIFTGIFAGLAGIIKGGNTAVSLILILLGIIVATALTVGFFWLLTRFFIVEVPLAIEDNVDAASTISRSWELTKGHVGRILSISFVAYLITLPIIIAIQVVRSISQAVFSLLLGHSAAYGLLFSLLVLGLIILSGAVMLPFWQAIKAVIYYDMRSRREGLGLTLRDRSI